MTYYAYRRLRILFNSPIPIRISGHWGWALLTASKGCTRMLFPELEYLVDLPLLLVSAYVLYAFLRDARNTAVQRDRARQADAIRRHLDGGPNA